MRINDVEVINLHFDYPEGKGFCYAGGTATGRVTSLVLVHTDTEHTGIGAVYSHPDLVRLIIERHLAPHLRGRDSGDIEGLWELMYGLTRWYGRKGVAVSALGGIDIALWDLRGKAAGKPIYELLGGADSQVPAYASGLLWVDDVQRLEDEAAQHAARGFRRVKARLGRSPEYDLQALDAIRRGVGPDNDILVDGSHRYTLEWAVWLAPELQSRGVFWFEEPFPPEDIDAYVALRALIRVPLAAGENDFGLEGFRELLRAGAIDIAQPDACRAGGLTACVHIGRLAGTHGVRIATHTWSDAVALVANAHLVAALPNGLTVEFDQTDNALVTDLLTPPLQVVDGMLELGNRPGLGISLNEATVERLRVEPGETTRQGNYSDLVFGADFLASAAPYDR